MVRSELTKQSEGATKQVVVNTLSLRRKYVSQIYICCLP